VALQCNVDKRTGIQINMSTYLCCLKITCRVFVIYWSCMCKILGNPDRKAYQHNLLEMWRMWISEITTVQSLRQTSHDSWCWQGTLLSERGSGGQPETARLRSSRYLLPSQSPSVESRSHSHIQGTNRWSCVAGDGRWWRHRLHGTGRWVVLDFRIGAGFSIDVRKTKFL